MNFLILFFLIIPVFAASPAMAHKVHEPTIQEVQEQAIHSMQFNQEEMNGWKKKAALSAALPRLQVGVTRQLKDVVSLTTKDNVSITSGDVTVGPNENNFDRNFDQGTSFEVRAVWLLNELIFNRDSLAVSNDRREWMRECNRILKEVSEAYFTRKRLLQELKKGRDRSTIREKKKLLVDQCVGIIDAYTGGWFSKESSL